MADVKGQVMKVHQAVARALADNGIETIFGLIGDANMFVCDSFIRECGGKYVAASHEYGSALMALGYSKISGKVGVCSVTHGPALVNTLTPLVQGVRASAPMVLVCGDTKSDDRGGAQNLPQREFATVTGAGFEQVRSPQTAVRDVATALRRAVAERRPIVLNIPIEINWLDVEYQPIHVQAPESRAIVAQSDDLDNAIGIIAAAKRPVIVAGRGATSPEARSAILKLARRIEAPLATSLKAKDLFRGEDYNLGISGPASTPISVEVILESDCLISFGASLNKYTTSMESFLKGKRVVQINLEPSEIGKNLEPTVGLVGDPAAVADLIVHWLDEAEIPPSGWYSEELKQKIAANVPELGPVADNGNGTVDFQHALARLDAALPADRIVVTDGGRFVNEVWRRIGTPGPDSFLAAIDIGSIGLGFSHGIGAALAAPGRQVVVVCGDGGFMHGGLAEFNTAVRAKLDLIVIVCNDGAYRAETAKFLLRDRDPGMSYFDWPDLEPVAVALGGNGVTVRSEADWVRVEAAIKDHRGPLLIDVKLDAARMVGGH